MIYKIKEKIQHAAQTLPPPKGVYFKTGKGEYAEHDQFIGVNVPTLRMIAKEFSDLSLQDIQTLLKSPINEERFLALIVLVNQYKLNPTDGLYNFYLENRSFVNNWNLVDASAHLIVGAHLFEREKSPLLDLAKSPVLWDRRISMVSTWYFIKQNQCEWTFKLAELFLNDSHDLMHKAVGWMLREAGKKDLPALVCFLNQHKHKMPRTMLRYSIEKFPEDTRKLYLNPSSLLIKKKLYSS